MLIKKSHSKKELLKKIKSLESEVNSKKNNNNIVQLDISNKLSLFLENEKIDIIIINRNDNSCSIVNAKLNILLLIPENIEDLKKIIQEEDQELFTSSFNKLKLNTSVKIQTKLHLQKNNIKEIKPVELVLIDDKSDIITIVIKDFSEQIKQKRELARVKDKIEESDKLKTILLSNISHQIRTPLNSITGFSELLAGSDMDKNKRKEYIHIIKSQSKHILNLIDDISEISKLEAGSINITKTPYNINRLLNELIFGINEQRTNTNKQQIIIELIIPETDVKEIISDSGRLQQVILNIVNYSLRYTQQGKIKIGYKIDSNTQRIEFFIIDTSDGLSKEEQKIIFNRFMIIDSSESSKLEDSGLCLTIAQKIINALGGKIWIESEKGQGTSYFFTIPYEKVKKNKVNKKIDEIINEENYNWSNKVILIVDDEDINAIFLDAVFQITGVRLLFAKNGLQAVELVKNINKIDLILMDLKMPVMNGLKATKEIRKFNSTIPIIAQTALASEKDKNNSQEAGCNSIITKPIEVDELLQLVSSYFAE